MNQKKKIKTPKHPIRRKVLRLLMIVFLAVLFLEFLVYFGSNLFLSNWARRKINESTHGVYEIDFNRVNFSLLRRGVFLDGIILKPIDPEMDQRDQALFNLHLDQLAVKGLWYGFNSGVLSIGKIELDNPNLSLDLPENVKLDYRRTKAASEEISRVKILENELKKSIDRLNFIGVYIHEIEINHADLFFLNFLSDNSIKAENTKLVVRDIDWASEGNWTTPFNARGFEFDLEDVHFLLPDSVHTLTAESVQVSSLENVINMGGLSLVPDRTKESKAYYEVSLKDLRVGNVDLNTAFMTSKVLIDEIILTNPDFKVERRRIASRESAFTGDLNELIAGLLESFEVKELSVLKGNFQTSDFEDSLKNRIEIKELDFKMVGFYLGTDQERQRNQFFYGEDASMNIKEAKLYLSDEIHVIYGESASLSSFKDELIIESVSVKPRDESLQMLDPDNIIQISLPKLAWHQVDLKKFYNEGILEMEEMIIDSPKVEFKDLKKNYQQPIKEGKVSELLQGYMDKVVIGQVKLNDGEVQFTDEAGLRSNDIGFERFSLLLENVLIRPNDYASVQDIFLADEMVLSLEKYRLKLRDDLHEFLADEILIDSKNSLLVVKNFSLKPENPESIQAALDSYDKTVTINVMIPEFRMEGIDLQAAFWDEKLIVREIKIPSPKAELRRYRKQKEDFLQKDQFSSSDEFERLLTPYFSYIQIDSINFSNGQVKYENYSGEKDIYLSEDSLSLKLKGFLIQRGASPDENKTFFSDEIDLSLRQYSFNVAGGNYEVYTDRLNYNSKSQTIFINNLQLVPSENIQSKLALHATLPQVAFRGVDLQSFLFENKLILDQLAVNGSEIELGINTSFNADRSLGIARNISRKALPESIFEIQIAEIDALDSRLTINYLAGGKHEQSIQTNFDLEVRRLRLDSMTTSKDNFTGLFEEFDLRLQDFSFALPDSVHNLTFTSLEVNNNAGEALFSDFEIKPINKMGKSGSPVVSAKIRQLGVKHNTLSDIESTRIFDLDQVRMSQPVINIYLDDKEKEERKKPNKTQNDSSFISSVILKNLMIEQGKITIHDKELGPLPKMAFSGVDFGIENLNLNLIGPDQKISPEFLLEKKLNLSWTDYHLITEDSLNQIKIGKVNLLNNDLILENVDFGPVIGRYEYMRTKGYQTDAVEGNIEKLRFVDLDFDSYFNSQFFKAGNLEIDGAELIVFRDKRFPKREGVIKPMPQEFFKNGLFNISLDSVILRGGRVEYQEFAPRAMVPGFINFEDLNFSIAPFVMAKPGVEFPLEKSLLSAQAKIRGEGQINLNSVYYYEPPYPMDLEISMGKFDLTKVNTMSALAAFVKVESGKVTGADWNFRINEEEAWGKMNFKYKDLKLELLDTVSLLPAGGKLGFFTFLANTFIKNSNPRRLFNNLVISDIYYERDKSKFVLGGWWRATFSGIKGAVGMGGTKIPKRKEEEDE